MKKKGQRLVKLRKGPNILLKPKNYLFFSLALISIGLGFYLLSRGSITVAPILLVIGYCVLIPLAILLR